MNASPQWMGKLIEQESDDVWLRTGVRIIVLVLAWALGLFVVALVENALTGDVSGITSMFVFAFGLLSLPSAAIALVCVAIGLIRRHL